MSPGPRASLGLLNLTRKGFSMSVSDRGPDPVVPQGQATGTADGEDQRPPAAPPSDPTWLRRVETLGLEGIEPPRKGVQEPFAGEDPRKSEQARDERLRSLTGSSAT